MLRPKVYSFRDLEYLAVKLESQAFNMRDTPEKSHILDAANALRISANAPTKIANEIEYTRTLSDHFADMGYRRPIIEADSLAKHLVLMIQTVQGLNRELMRARLAVFKPVGDSAGKLVSVTCRLCGAEAATLDAIPHKQDCSWYDTRR